MSQPSYQSVPRSETKNASQYALLNQSGSAVSEASDQQTSAPFKTSLLQMQGDFSQVPVHASAQPIQRQIGSPASLPATAPQPENNTGLPDNLKSSVEAISGYSMDDVRVHYNSSKPAGINALAYAQGTNIHLGPGQEKHLPHEAWHVVQQKQGRVQPTLDVNGASINDNLSLEMEADSFAKISPVRKSFSPVTEKVNKAQTTTFEVYQRVKTIAHILGKSIPIDTDSLNPELISKAEKPGIRAALRQVVEKQEVRYQDGSSEKTKAASKSDVREAEDFLNRLGTGTEGDLSVFPEFEDIAKHLWPKKTFSNKRDLMFAVVGTVLTSSDTALKTRLLGELKNHKKAIALTQQVRHGGEHEQILTSATVGLWIRSLEGSFKGAVSKSTGEPVSLVDVQLGTNVPTQDVVFKKTENIGGKMFQTHHPTSTDFIGANVESKSKAGAPKRKAVQGSGSGSSSDFHIGAGRSLKKAAQISSGTQTLTRRVGKTNKEFLATKSDILAVPASARGDQIYQSEDGTTLRFDNEEELKEIAQQVGRRNKEAIDKLKKQDVDMATEGSEELSASPLSPVSDFF